MFGRLSRVFFFKSESSFNRAYSDMYDKSATSCKNVSKYYLPSNAVLTTYFFNSSTPSTNFSPNQLAVCNASFISWNYPVDSYITTFVIKADKIVLAHFFYRRFSLLILNFVMYFSEFTRNRNSPDNITKALSIYSRALSYYSVSIKKLANIILLLAHKLINEGLAECTNEAHILSASWRKKYVNLTFPDCLYMTAVLKMSSTELYHNYSNSNWMLRSFSLRWIISATRSP